MKRKEQAEYEFIRQIEQKDFKDVVLVFYYTVDMDGCTFSYSQGKRKAFSVSVMPDQYQGKLRVICKRDASGKYEVSVYTDQGKKLDIRMEYG